jgi:3-oxoacyl-[acyl-carrier protein] reductase
MDLGLSKRVAIVTGSSQGIGRATALALGREGARVAITYKEHPEKAAEVAQAIAHMGGEALTVGLDLGSAESIHQATRSVLERWGNIDILVNNAVQWGTRPPWNAPLFEEVPIEEWTRLYRTNSEGAYLAIQNVLPAMRRQAWGRIVNISSGIAVDGFAGSGPYAAAKAALHGLTRTLCKELGPAGILVNVVMPGLTLTERNAARLPAELRAQVEQNSPIRRVLPPEEVAPMIVFLCSAANTAVTGEIIRASGGIT